MDIYLWIVYIIQFLITLIFGTVSNVACLMGPKFVPMDIQELKGSGQIHLVAFNDFPASTLDNFARYYHEKYGLQVRVEPNRMLLGSAYDPERKQYVAERLVEQMRNKRASSGGDSRDIYIAFTDQDIYIRKYTWRYAFSYREKDGLVVISSVRMSYPYFGFWPISMEKKEVRLRKMTTKNIGVLYYRLPQSDHCRSVMFNKVMGPQELDIMGEDF